MRFGQTVQLYTAKWYLMRLPYVEGKTQEYNAWLKEVVPLRVFDRANKGWLIPDAYIVLALNEASNMKLLTQQHANECIQLVARDAHKARVDIAGGADNHYINLGLQPGAPYTFVCMAWEFWKRHFKEQTGAYAQLAACENAFNELTKIHLTAGDLPEQAL